MNTHTLHNAEAYERHVKTLRTFGIDIAPDPNRDVFIFVDHFAAAAILDRGFYQSPEEASYTVDFWLVDYLYEAAKRRGVELRDELVARLDFSAKGRSV